MAHVNHNHDSYFLQGGESKKKNDSEEKTLEAIAPS